MGNWKNFERWVGVEMFDGSKRNWGSGGTNSRDDGKPRTGDVINPVWEIECKLYKTLAPARWVYDLAGSVEDTISRIPVVVHKKKGVPRTYCLIRYRDYMKLKDESGLEVAEDILRKQKLLRDKEFPYELLALDNYHVHYEEVTNSQVDSWWEKLEVEALTSNKVPVLIMRETGNKDTVTVALDIDTFYTLLLERHNKGGKWEWSNPYTPAQVRNRLNKLKEIYIKNDKIMVSRTISNNEKVLQGILALGDEEEVDLTKLLKEYDSVYHQGKFISTTQFDKLNK